MWRNPAIVALFVLLLGETATAAKIKFLPGQPPTITFRGTFAPGDASNLISMATKNPSAIIDFESTGGQMYEAGRIATFLRANPRTTRVRARKECTSACAIAWLFGKPRLMDTNSRIGFHAVYQRTKRGNVQSGEGNALLGAFLLESGFSYDLIRFATRSAPNEVSWLTVEKAKELGIEVMVRVELPPPPIPRPKPIEILMQAANAIQGREVLSFGLSGSSKGVAVIGAKASARGRAADIETANARDQLSIHYLLTSKERTEDPLHGSPFEFGKEMTPTFSIAVPETFTPELHTQTPNKLRKKFNGRVIGDTVAPGDDAAVHSTIKEPRAELETKASFGVKVAPPLPTVQSKQIYDRIVGDSEVPSQQ